MLLSISRIGLFNQNRIAEQISVFSLQIWVVGLHGLEPRTNRLWADRSNQLS